MSGDFYDEVQENNEDYLPPTNIKEESLAIKCLIEQAYLILGLRPWWGQ